MFMVVPAEMQNAMHQQLGDPLVQAQARRPGFPAGGVHGDDHIAQKGWGEIGESAFAHRKGNDVGRASPAEKPLVQLTDLRIIHQKDRELGVRML